MPEPSVGVFAGINEDLRSDSKDVECEIWISFVFEIGQQSLA